MCSTKNERETVPANQLCAGDVLLVTRHPFTVDAVSNIAGRVRVEAKGRTHDDLWLDSCDHVEVVAA